MIEFGDQLNQIIGI